MIAVQGISTDPPRGRQRQVKQIQGTVTQAFYVQQHDRLRWAFAEEDIEGSKWLALHTWSENGNRWDHRILFRTLKQARRGHRVRNLHGQKMSISYSVGVECQLVAVREESEGILWWVFYFEGPDSSLIHMVSLQVVESPAVLC